ncbi:MAG TPA: hypothetical protein VF756_17305 [Thermoanaerobaculia bacterium]
MLKFRTVPGCGPLPAGASPVVHSGGEKNSIDQDARVVREEGARRARQDAFSVADDLLTLTRRECGRAQRHHTLGVAGEFDLDVQRQIDGIADLCDLDGRRLASAAGLNELAVLKEDGVPLGEVKEVSSWTSSACTRSMSTRGVNSSGRLSLTGSSSICTWRWLPTCSTLTCWTSPASRLPFFVKPPVAPTVMYRMPSSVPLSWS